MPPTFQERRLAFDESSPLTMIPPGVLGRISMTGVTAILQRIVHLSTKQNLFNHTDLHWSSVDKEQGLVAYNALRHASRPSINMETYLSDVDEFQNLIIWHAVHDGRANTQHTIETLDHHYLKKKWRIFRKDFSLRVSQSVPMLKRKRSIELEIESEEKKNIKLQDEVRELEKQVEMEERRQIQREKKQLEKWKSTNEALEARRREVLAKLKELKESSSGADEE